jgi:hypothetical protein
MSLLRPMAKLRGRRRIQRLFQRFVQLPLNPVAR